MGLRLKPVFLFFFLLAFTTFLKAQINIGALRGKVVDIINSDELDFATVVLTQITH